jgi:thiamine kinase-like enzyme
MILEKKVQLIFQDIGKTVQDFSVLGKGEASVVLKVNTNDGIYALKTALYPGRKKKVLQEVEFRNYFINQGLDCIPLPVHSDSTFFSNGAVIYEYIEGTMPNFTDLNIIKQFARIVSSIHKIKFEIIDDGFINIKNEFNFLKKTTKKITTKYSHLVNDAIKTAFDLAIKEFKELMNQQGDKFTIGINAQLHGDLSDNFIVDLNNKIWLLDWENSEYGDIIGEIIWFLNINKVTLEARDIFYQEYQQHFAPARKISFADIFPLYVSMVPVFNICWGIDQLDMNIVQKLEPERKLRDLAISAKNWKPFYSSEASAKIKEGIDSLTQKVHNS